jgi:HEAT repeat protein
MSSINKWVTFYNSTNPRIRSRAIEILINNYPTEIPFETVISLIEDFPFGHEINVRYKKFEHIILINYNERLFQLMNSYLYTNDRVRVVLAADIFSKVKEIRAVNRLLELLENEEPNKDKIGIGWRCGHALASIADKSSEERLRKIYEKRKHDNVNVVIAIQSALKAVGAN